VLLLLFGVPVCLLPLAAYLLALAMLNHRRPPTLVPGAWDFAYALLGLSGFLVLGGPLLLTGFEAGWRRFWLHGDAPPAGWWLVAALYLVALLGLLAWLLARRRRVTVVYNARPSLVREALAAALGRLGRHWTEGPGHFLLRNPKGDGDGPAKPPAEPLLVELDAFGGLRSATLVWHRAGRFERAEVEETVRDELARLDALAPDPTPNPLVSWLMTAAASFTIIALFSLGVLIYLVTGALRR
jgi:hypothetical protein